MATNLHIDPDLLDEAKDISGARTKRETVEMALREFVQRRQRHGVIELFGAVEFDDDYDYKAERQRR